MQRIRQLMDIHISMHKKEASGKELKASMHVAIASYVAS